MTSISPGWPDLVALAVFACVVTLLFLPRLRNSPMWMATVTPLASIIGSGFLVVAPLLADIGGRFAFVLMGLLVLVGFGLGEVLRFNISRLEDITESKDPSSKTIDRILRKLDHAAKLALALSYIIAITFYIALLSSFVSRAVGLNVAYIKELLATFVLTVIGVCGFLGDLPLLERLEVYSVNIKLSVIAALIAGLVWHDCAHGLSLISLSGAGGHFDLRAVRQLLGAILVVQGFETSRYLGDEYSKDIRITSMRRAQIISGMIYILFVGLVIPVIGNYHVANDTEIIDISERVAVVLPLMLTFGAVLSQFSAAIADLLGGGGLILEASGGKVKTKYLYPAGAAISTVIIWSTDVFSIITIASRTFAAYYFLQSLMAGVFLFPRETSVEGRLWRLFLFGALAVLMLIACLFGLSVES